MSTLFSRQDIYDYCRSVFSRQAVDVHTTPLCVGAETIMVVPGISRPGTPFQPVSLSEWLEVKEKDTMLVYQLYHFQVCDVSYDVPHYTYQMEPVADTKTAFPSSAALDKPFIGLWVTGSHSVILESTDNDIHYLYPFELVIDQLNMQQAPGYKQQAEHLARDIRERLYSTVNDRLPDPAFQRDVFRQRFLRQSGHCAGFYGIPFLLGLHYLPAVSWLMVLFFIVDCYLYRKNTIRLNRIMITSLYELVGAWRPHRTLCPHTALSYGHWAVQTRTLLHGLKRWPRTCLNNRQQIAYLTPLDNLLEKVNQDNLTEEDIMSVNTGIKNVLLSYTTLAYYH